MPYVQRCPTNDALNSLAVFAIYIESLLFMWELFNRCMVNRPCTLVHKHIDAYYECGSNQQQGEKKIVKNPCIDFKNQFDSKKSHRVVLWCNRKCSLMHSQRVSRIEMGLIQSQYNCLFDETCFFFVYSFQLIHTHIWRDRCIDLLHATPMNLIFLLISLDACCARSFGFYRIFHCVSRIVFGTSHW